DIGMDSLPNQQFYAYGTYWHQYNSLIEDSEFYNIGGIGIHFYQSDHASGDGSNNTFRNNSFHHIGLYPILQKGGNGTQIYNNVMWDSGWQIGGNHNPAILSSSWGDNTLVANNTIHDHHDKCIELGGSNVTARNNICSATGDNTITLSGGGATVDHNLCYPTSGAGCTVSGNPQFANAA